MMKASRMALSVLAAFCSCRFSRRRVLAWTAFFFCDDDGPLPVCTELDENIGCAGRCLPEVEPAEAATSELSTGCSSVIESLNRFCLLGSSSRLSASFGGFRQSSSVLSSSGSVTRLLIVFCQESSDTDFVKSARFATE